MVYVFLVCEGFCSHLYESRLTTSGENKHILNGVEPIHNFAQVQVSNFKLLIITMYLKVNCVEDCCWLLVD